MLLPHIQSPLLCLRQQVNWKDTHCPHKIRAPLDEENGSYGNVVTSQEWIKSVFRLRLTLEFHLSVLCPKT